MRLLKLNSEVFSLPALLLVVALLGMATGLIFWTSVPLAALCAYLLLITPFTLIKKAVSTDAIFWTATGFFLWVVCSDLLLAQSHTLWKDVLRNCVWVGLPFCFALLRSALAIYISRIVFGFTVALAVVSLFCFCSQAITVLNAASAEQLFYHALLSPFRLHAVFFSVYILFSLFYWSHHFAEAQMTPALRRILLFSLIWLIICMLLLASKLCIVALIVFALWLIVKQQRLQQPKQLAALIILISVVVGFLMLPNPVQRRFADVRLNISQTWNKKQFAASDYLDGVSFRLLQWRWVPQALTQEQAWLTGVGSRNAQQVLDNQYRSAGLFMGDAVENKGYGAFDAHNSFLQTLLERGVPGLILLLFYLTLLLQSIKQRNPSTLLFYFLVLLFCCTESLVSSQWGLMVLLLLPQLLRCSKPLHTHGKG